MDFILELVAGLFEVVKPKVATAIMTAVGLIIGVIGVTWHSHEQAAVARCSSVSGRFGQLFNGSSLADCGLSSILSKVAVVVEVVGFLVAAGFAVALVVLLVRSDRPGQPDPGQPNPNNAN